MSSVGTYLWHMACQVCRWTQDSWRGLQSAHLVGSMHRQACWVVGFVCGLADLWDLWVGWLAVSTVQLARPVGWLLRSLCHLLWALTFPLFFAAPKQSSYASSLSVMGEGRHELAYQTCLEMLGKLHTHSVLSLFIWQEKSQHEEVFLGDEWTGLKAGDIDKVKLYFLHFSMQALSDIVLCWGTGTSQLDSCKGMFIPEWLLNWWFSQETETSYTAIFTDKGKLSRIDKAMLKRKNKVGKTSLPILKT